MTTVAGASDQTLVLRIDPQASRVLDTDGDQHVSAEELGRGLRDDRVRISPSALVTTQTPATPAPDPVFPPPSRRTGNSPVRPPDVARLRAIVDVAADRLNRQTANGSERMRLRDEAYGALTQLAWGAAPGSQVARIAHAARQEAGPRWDSWETVDALINAVMRIYELPDTAFVSGP